MPYALATAHISEQTRNTFSRNTLKRWLLDWPLYLILGVSAFLHFFRIQTIEFDFDQANLFQLARDTVAHGLIPLSSNEASINILHAPFFIYTLLPAAMLSDNPLGGAIIVGLCTTAMAILTYLFTRRYFGFWPAVVAGLLNAAVYNPLKYSRGIWQPDILPFFVVLFLFAIFRGAVERRRGWFLPAVALVAMIYQLHPSSILGMSVLLLSALILAPSTVRRRDYVLAAGALILLFLPYVLLELLSHFSDIQGIIAFARLPAHNDTQAFNFYLNLILPFDEFQPGWMHMLGWCMQILLLAGFMVAIIRLFWPRQSRTEGREEQQNVSAHRWLRVWDALRFNPGRVSLLLLLLWQVVPFANLIHHSVDLHMQYFLLFLPGPFILIGLALNEIVHLAKRIFSRWSFVPKVAVVLLSMLLILGQFVSSTAYLLKMSEGHFNDRTIQNIPYVNDLNSLWNAVHAADQLAQERHISRIFMSMDSNIQPAMTYLGATLHTPTTVFGYDNCLILPTTATGAAVYLIGPYADRIDAMLHQFATADLVAQPPRLGGQPFKLYLVTPKAVDSTAAPSSNVTASFPQLEQDAQVVTEQTDRMAVTRWRIQREAPVAPRTLYNYQLSLTPDAGAKPITTTCAVTALYKNDQLVAAFPLSGDQVGVTQAAIRGLAFDTVPDTHHVGPLRFTSFHTRTINTSSFPGQ